MIDLNALESHLKLMSEKVDRELEVHLIQNSLLSQDIENLCLEIGEQEKMKRNYHCKLLEQMQMTKDLLNENNIYFVNEEKAQILGVQDILLDIVDNVIKE